MFVLTVLQDQKLKIPYSSEAPFNEGFMVKLDFKVLKIGIFFSMFTKGFKQSSIN